jgi:PAS domain S-box-containing protein
VAELRDDRLLRRFQGAGLLAAILAMGLAASTLLGWILDIPVLERIAPDSPPMVVTTALGLVACAAALVCLHRGRTATSRIAGHLLAAAGLTIGVATIAEYVFSIELWIERLLVLVGLESATVRLRPSPETALSFTLVGLGTLLTGARGARLRRMGEVLFLMSAAVALLSLTGHLVGARVLYSMFSPAPIIGMAIHTACAFLCITIAALGLGAERGMASLLASRTAGGVIARRLLVVLFFAPPAVEVLISAAVKAEHLEPALGRAAALIFVPAIFLVMTWVTARKLEQVDTARRRSEALISEKEEQYRDLFNLAPDAIFTADLAGRFTDVNEAGCALLDYRRDEIVGRTIVDIIPPEDAPRLEATRQRLLVPGTVWVAEWRIRHKDGTLIPIEVSAKILPGGRWQGFARDVRERKLAERRLQEAEARFRALFESAHDAIVVVDGRGEIRLVNPRTRYWFGYPPEELVGQPIEVLVPERFRENHVQRRDRYLAAPETRAIGSDRDLSARRRDGSEFTVDISLSPLPATERDGPLVMATVRDISRLKAVERRERLMAEIGRKLSEPLDRRGRLERAGELLASHLVDWCVIDLLEADGTVERVAVVHRDAGKRHLAELLRQIPPDPAGVRRAVGMARAYEPPEATPVASDVREQSCQTFESIGFRHAALELARALGPGPCLVLPLAARGRLFGVVLLVKSDGQFSRDDVEVGAVAADRIALLADNAFLYEEANAALRARDDIVAIVSHDLKNPLFAIAMATHALELTVQREEPRPEVRSRMLNTVHGIADATSAAGRLISDLLDVAKIEAGGFSVETNAEEPASLAEEALTSLEPAASTKAIHLKLTAPPGLPAVEADRPRVLQILSNLLGNAIRFTPEGGVIEVDLREAESGDVLFAVRDTGIGIAEAALPHVFDRYWQARAASREGTGLGLSIAKGIVEAHGGRIWAESRLGGGSTFFFTLPTARRGPSTISTQKSA